MSISRLTFSSKENPCLRCGACCASLRVSFYWTEADPASGGRVPEELTEDISPYLNCMRGTNQPKPRCVALAGQVGQDARCTIYDSRPSPCEDFGIHWQAGAASIDEEDVERCNRVRAAWGLPPLEMGQSA